MGLAARKLEAAPRPHLRLVHDSSRPGGTSRKSPREGECRALFTAVVVLFLAVTALGLVRVALTSELTRAAFDSGELQERIKAEREIGERLEADRSALLTPSRIEALAADTMKMREPTDVRYMHLGRGLRSDSSAVQRATASAVGSSAFSRMMATAMELMADEARALLTGDLGLASSR